MENRDELFDPLDRLVKVGEFQSITGLSQTKAYNVVAERQIPSIRIGKSIRIRYGDIVEFIKRGTVHAQTEMEADNG